MAQTSTPDAQLVEKNPSEVPLKGTAQRDAVEENAEAVTWPVEPVVPVLPAGPLVVEEPAAVPVLEDELPLAVVDELPLAVVAEPAAPVLLEPEALLVELETVLPEVDGPPEVVAPLAPLVVALGVPEVVRLGVPEVPVPEVVPVGEVPPQADSVIAPVASTSQQRIRAASDAWP